jgi:hypothetical protein
MDDAGFQAFEPFTLVRLQAPCLCRGLRVDAQATAYMRPGNAKKVRAAQAYMLISMPTGSSAIFGAFQDMFGSL